MRFGSWIHHAPWPAAICRLHKRAVPEVLEVLQPFRNALPPPTRRTVQKREHILTRPEVISAEGKTLAKQRAGTEVAS
jgi:hypothetical protein